MTAAQIGPITIEYEQTGEGEPLLLVMGLGAQLIQWPDEFVERLARRGYRVTRFDNRDIGLSTKFPGEPQKLSRTLGALVSKRLAKSDYLLSDMANDALGLLDHVGVARAHVVGASMGGMIAQSIAIAAPERVASLTSIMSNTGDRTNGRMSLALARKVPKYLRRNDDERFDNALEMARLIAGPGFDEAETAQLIRRATARDPDLLGTGRQMAAIAASPDRTEALGQLDLPALVIHGLLDPLVLPSGGIATATAIRGSRLLMFPDMAHDLPKNRWDETIDAIVSNAGRATTAAAERN